MLPSKQTISTSPRCSWYSSFSDFKNKLPKIVNYNYYWIIIIEFIRALNLPLSCLRTTFGVKFIFVIKKANFSLDPCLNRQVKYNYLLRTKFENSASKIKVRSTYADEVSCWKNVKRKERAGSNCNTCLEILTVFNYFFCDNI